MLTTPKSILRTLIGLLLLAASTTALAAKTDKTREEQLLDSMYYYFDHGIAKQFHDYNKAYMDACLAQGDMSSYYNGWANRVIFELNESNLFQAYKEALAMSRDMREKKQEKFMYMGTGALGLIYADCNNLEGARTCFLETIEQLKKLGMKDELVPLYMDLAYVSIEKYPEQALQWSGEAVRLSADESALCDASAFKGLLEFKQRNFKAFLENYKRYKELEQKGMTSIYGKFIEIYHACYSGNFQRAIRLADAITSPLDRYDYLRQVYDFRGDSLQAYRVLRRQTEVNDSINSTILTDNLRGISNELEMAQTQQREAQQRIIMLWIVVVAAALMIIGLVYIIVNRRRFIRRLEQGHKKLQEAYDQLEETTTAKERMESELRIARDIQMSMVPSQFPKRPDLDLYASMTTAKEVGGDLYSYLFVDEQLYFCVGDVSGKGIPASLFMAQAIRLFRILAAEKLMPADIANRLNAELAADNEQGMFVTMFIGLVDLTTGHLSFCNAGHNPPVFDNRFLQMEPNAPIGLWPTLDYVGEEISDIRGKYFFVYTDGLNEAENPQQEQFGDDRLLSILATETFPSAQACIEHMKRQVEQHRQGADPNDDLTLLCLRIID